MDIDTSPSDGMKASPSDGMKASSSDGMKSLPSGQTDVSSSSSLVLSFPNLDETDEKKLLAYGNGKYIRVRPPWINANHFFQKKTGPGRKGVRTRG